MATLAALLLVTASLGLLGERSDLIRCGGDLAEGVLINRTPGAGPASTIDSARPTLVFIHGFNPLPRHVHFEMAKRLSEALARRSGGCPVNLLEWDWNGRTFVGLRLSTNTEAAIRQGPRLASALIRSGVQPGRLHLIGHSAGSLVAASAARCLISWIGVPVAQLTVLEPAAYYHDALFNRLGAGSAARRVENYWAEGPSGFGQAAHYPGIFNACVRGRTPWLGVVAPMRSGHLDVVRWYVATAEQPDRPLGFNASLLLGAGRTAEDAEAHR
jgi:pimeloyl-ACP methyl ester carboxylesterase